MSDNLTTELQGILDEFEHECFMLRVEASETRARGDVVRKSYERIRDEFAGCIAATLGSEREERLEKLVHIYGEIANYFCERFACCDAEFANCKYCIGLPQGGQCELGWCNDESRALGIEQPDYGGGECEPVNLQELYDRIGELENERATHGTLTAEQVKRIHEVIEKHWHDLPADYDMPEATALSEYSYDWQAIADELNAVLEGRKVGE